MAPREEEKQNRPAPAAATEVADQKATDETVANDVDADCPFKDEPDDDDAIRNLNKIGRMKLSPPEFIQELKEGHREFIAFSDIFYEKFRKAREEERIAAAAAAATVQSSSHDTSKL